MRFVHAADLHLGLRITRFGADVNGRIREARLKALEILVDQARDQAVDFVLLAGDLFDDNHVDGTTSRRAYEMLESLPMPVIVIPGNHDPWTADSVYARPPWGNPGERIRVARTRAPIAVSGGIVWPCPLVAKNSLDDPTRWISPREPGDPTIRIGLAHGSLNDRENLPPDDHLIDRHCADSKGLDYLALGHWHRPARYADRVGIVRTAYPGVHEPMRFSEAPDYATGWTAYSSSAGPDLFTDDGKGRALLVSVDTAGAVPQIEELDTGRLTWRDETRILRDEAELSALINELGHRKNQGNQLLRLHLKGTLPAGALARLDELDLTRSGGEGGVLSRYFWAELDTDQLLAEPTEGELQNLAGNGVVRLVYDRLRDESQRGDPQSQELARQALLLLYRFAQEVSA